MSRIKAILASIAFAFAFDGVFAQSATTAAACSSTKTPEHAQPSVAAGWTAHVVASGLTNPRGIIFDEQNGLLVVQRGLGIVRYDLIGDGACTVVGRKARIVVEDGDLNHGIALSSDGGTLYASSPSAVYAWGYNTSQGTTTSERREVIGDMGDSEGHSTRTLEMSRHKEGMLLVSRGSMANLDPAASDPSTGVSTIKAFNLSDPSTSSPYSYRKDGRLLGWGLRNSVGVAEEPLTGTIYSVENSADNVQRDGRDVHENNPGEELNGHGNLDFSGDVLGPNYGYPRCFAAWSVDEIPQKDNLTVGSAFAIGTLNATNNDDYCKEKTVPPVLTFAAHMAPLDIKFNSNGTTAWIAFHGSWNRDQPQGYKLSAIAFSNGRPVEPSNSSTAAIDIVSNADLSKCPKECFRPVGLAFDKQGRLFMSSDSTGEIWVVMRAEGGSADGASPTPSGGVPSGTEAAPSATKTGGANAVGYGGLGFGVVWAGVVVLGLM